MTSKAIPAWLNSAAWVSKPRSPNNSYSSSATSSSTRLESTSNPGDNKDDTSTFARNYRKDSGNSVQQRQTNASGSVPNSLQSTESQEHVSPTEDNQVVRIASSFNYRVTLFNSELSRRRIHLAELQHLSAQGIPDAGGIRATTWKVLLGYLPRNREDWATELAKKRAMYVVFREEMIINPSKITRRKEEMAALKAAELEALEGPLQRQEITHDDHPLSLGSKSVWHQFFQDTELAEQINRDVKRTHPDMQFFCGEDEFALENQEALKRILLIFAKLNPGIRYVQGMNEVLAPLYYVFKTDIDKTNAAHAEEDSFFCFVELLSDFRDHFCKQLDNSAVGIRFTMTQMTELLRHHDEELWRHLEITCKINSQFYAFRWITLLLTQEFDFAESLRLWDTLLSNPDGPLEMLLRVCCSMLLCLRSRLLAGDFTTNLKLLQHYPSVDINHLVKVADDFRN